jgi:hypothetical protein
VGQVAPPLAASLEMVRERDWEPEPQVLEHSVQAVHLETTQSTGQAFLPHSCVWDETPQALPPLAAMRVVVRVRIWVPVPQVLEQVLYLDQAPWTQSTAQAAVLQLRVSARLPQALPWC